MAIGIAVLALIILFVYYHTVHKRRLYPPGPTPWPLLGNAMTLAPLGGNLDFKFIEWRKVRRDARIECRQLTLWTLHLLMTIIHDLTL